MSVLRRWVALLLILGASFIIGNASAQDKKQISLDLKEGANLIYRCRDKHWACVDNEAWGDCKQVREKAKNRRDPDLKCVPFYSFKMTGDAMKSEDSQSGSGSASDSANKQCFSYQSQMNWSIKGRAIESLCTATEVELTFPIR